MSLAGTTTPSNGKDHRDIGRIDLLLVGNADGPSETALAQSLAERSAQPISGIGQHTAKTDPGNTNTIDLGQRDLGLGPIIPAILGDASPIEAGRIAGPSLRQKQP